MWGEASRNEVEVTHAGRVQGGRAVRRRRAQHPSALHPEGWGRAPGVNTPRSVHLDADGEGHTSALKDKDNKEAEDEQGTGEYRCGDEHDEGEAGGDGQSPGTDPSEDAEPPRIEYPVPDVVADFFDPEDAAQVGTAQKELIAALWNDGDIVNKLTRHPDSTDIRRVQAVINEDTNSKELRSDEDMPDFYAFQQSKINSGKVGLKYNIACHALSVSPADGRIAGITIPPKPHQISGLAWMLRQEEGQLKGPRHAAQGVVDVTVMRGGILGDDPGLGKTLICIALLVYRSSHHPPGTTFKPSLVLCPAQLLPNWLEELQRRAPGLWVILFWGNKDSSVQD